MRLANIVNAKHLQADVKNNALPQYSWYTPNIYHVLLGEMVKPNTVASEIFNHYSLLRTVEEYFQLGNLGRNDLMADWSRFLWGEEPPAFNWADHSQ